MKIKSVGDILREERTSRHVSLDFLANQTHIKREYLEALENNQFEKLPAAIFVKGYIKTYARIFNFEYKPLLALLRRDYKESAKGKLIPREFIKPVLRRKVTWTPMTISVILSGTVFAVLASFIVYKWYLFNQPPFIEIYAPIEGGEVSSRVMVEGKTDPEALVVVNSQPTTLQTDGTFSTEVSLSHEGNNTITIESTDKRGQTNIVQKTVQVKF